MLNVEQGIMPLVYEVTWFIMDIIECVTPPVVLNTIIIGRVKQYRAPLELFRSNSHVVEADGKNEDSIGSQQAKTVV